MLERLTVGPIGENVYVLASDGACILVDPGDQAARILDFLDSRKLVPTMIVATHGHLDHTGAIPELLDAWRGRGAAVPLAIHAADASYLGAAAEDTNRRLFASIHALGYFRGKWRELPEPDLLLADGDRIPGTSFGVIHSPGHSPGSICLYSGAEAVLVSGDTLFCDGYGRTDCFDSDPEALARSLGRLFALPDETRVLPGHGEETTIGRESGRR
jgi:glyoxylase-like metal-dependent hydrolase (beta-lactamase superfamily II)